MHAQKKKDVASRHSRITMLTDTNTHKDKHTSETITSLAMAIGNDILRT